jgi:hypothetical protein
MPGSPMPADEPDLINAERRRCGPILGSVLLLVVVLLALDLYTVRFVAAERELYRADQLAYWSFSSQLADDLRQHPWAAVQAVAASVAHSDINLLPAVPIAIPMLVAGNSRVAYLLSVINIYGLAALVVLLAVLMRTAAPTRLVLVAYLAALLMLPGLWRPVLIGYLDIGGVALGMIVLAAYLRNDALSHRPKDLALLGFLVGLLAVSRRWFGLWSVAFCGVVVLDAVWCAWRSRSLDRHRLWQAARVPFVLGLSAAATVAVLAGPIAMRRIGPGYAERFSAYSSSSSAAELMAKVIAEYGLISLGLLVACVVLLIGRRTTRRFGVLVSLHIACTFTMMVSVQDHSPQHWYLYAAGVLLVIGTGFVMLFETVRPSRRLAVISGFLVLGVLLTTSVYSVRAEAVANALGPLVPDQRVRPIIREDIDEVFRLIGELDHLAARDPGYIYVLGATGTLSEQTLAFANLSLGTAFKSLPLILRSSHVDLRDGFPDMLLEARYVVVPDPAQWEMRAEDHQVVIIPTASFHERRNIARAFERLPERFSLREGVEVSVYRKTRSIRPEEIQELSALLRAKYPERPEIYLPLDARR